MAKTKVSSKYQVVIPKAIRTKIGLKEGQLLNVYPVGESVLLTPRKKWPDDYLGSEKDIWSKIDVGRYLAEERGSWQ